MEVTIVVLQLFTAVTALAGGALLVIRPDGSLLSADTALLAGTPFSDWLVPGLLLAVLVGVGFLAVGWWRWIQGPFAAVLSIVAGIGLVAFEIVEFSIIGFHPLQVVYGILGLTLIALTLIVHLREPRPGVPSQSARRGR